MNTAAQAKPDNSYVEALAGGTVFVGKDATMLFAAISLRAAVKLYLKTGLMPYRGMTATRMLASVTTYTQQEYKGNGKWDRALADLHNWVETMKTGMPVVDHRELK